MQEEHFVFDSKSLDQWFLQHKRDFIWRKNLTPYKVWIREVMLQQTRANVVEKYFQKWFKLFPNISSLANASFEKVIKTWEGLGYYQRVRNIHEAANIIVNEFDGKLPNQKKDLQKIKGLGPYTIGAILLFGFHKKAVAVDANVMRVLSRYFCINQDVSKVKTKRQIEKLQEKLLDKKKPWITAEALIELGAIICLIKPKCEICPLKKTCLAKKQNKTLILPKKTKKTPLQKITRAVFVIQNKNAFLLIKEEKNRVMQDLYEFPYFPFEEAFKDEENIKQKIKEYFGLNVEIVKELPSVGHSFTRYQVTLFVYLLKANKQKYINNYQWIDLKKIHQLPFSSGHRKIYNKLLSENFL